LAPLFVIVVASFGETATGRAVFPPPGLTLRWYAGIQREYLGALGASVALAGAVVLICVLLGVPAAIGLARSQWRGKAVVAAVFRAPVQIPAVVTGVAFLQMYYVLADYTGWTGAG